MYNTILNPVDQLPHISPIMTKEKSDSNTRHTIIYPSWPKVQSVNDGVKTDSYLGNAFQLYYPSVDDLVSRLN